MENILHIVFHRFLPGMVFPGSSVVFVPGLQCTFWQGSNGQLKVLDENMPMAQKPVHTLAHRNHVQRRGGEHAEQSPGLTVEHVTAGFAVWIIEHVQQVGKQGHNLRVNLQNGGSHLGIFFEEDPGSVSVVGAAMPMLHHKQLDVQLGPEFCLNIPK